MLFKEGKYISAVLAGGLVAPGIYTIRFILMGRGHDMTEFQEAQAALGLNYSGHFLDWIFLGIVSCGTVLWICRKVPRFKSIIRVLIGIVITFILCIKLQNFNNIIFNPIFLHMRI